MTAYASAANGAWGTAGNWAPAGVPGAGDTVSISHLITDNQNRTIGTGAGTAVTIVAGGILRHLAPGAAVTFTIQGNVSVAGTWGTSSPYSTAAADRLVITQTMAFSNIFLTGAGKLDFHGWPGFNESSDLDRTLTASAVTGGVSNQVTLAQDLGLRAGGGDILCLASDTNGATGAELVTTTGYNPGTKVVTIAGTFASNHASGTRIMNMSRQIQFTPSVKPNMVFNTQLTPGTGGVQSILDHVELNGMGLSFVYGAFYNASLGHWVQLADCSVVDCQGVTQWTGVCNEFDYDDTFEMIRCNVGKSRVGSHVNARATILRGDDCWYIGEPYVWKTDNHSSFLYEDSLFDSNTQMAFFNSAGYNKFRLRGCTLARVNTTNRMFDTVNIVGASEWLEAVLDHCLMDSSFDTLVRTQTKLTSESKVVVIHRNQVADANEMLSVYGTVYLDSSVVYAGQGASLRFEPVSSSWPLKHVFYVPVQANKAVKAKVWVQKNSTYGSSNRPTLKMRGTGFSEQTDTMADTTDTWEQLEVQATPSKASMAEIELWVQSAGASAKAYFDAFSMELV